MSEHESHEYETHELNDLESLLRDVRLAQPSQGLDRRIGAMFRSPWRMFIGPLSGFAAGILVTVGVFRYAPPAGAHPTPATPVSSSVRSAPAPIPSLLIESRRVQTLGNGEVNGLPVRLEQRQSRLVFLHQTTTGLWRAELETPKQTFVRNADFN